MQHDSVFILKRELNSIEKANAAAQAAKRNVCNLLRIEKCAKAEKRRWNKKKRKKNANTAKNKAENYSRSVVIVR